MDYKEFLEMRGITLSAAGKPDEAKAPGYGAMKKAELIEAAKQMGVYTGEMDKPSTCKAEIIEVLTAAGKNAGAKAPDADTGKE
ncbi:MAG: hypothetical protein LBI67_00925 [Treponema sp.]|jgi:hypothetical protein|nr:hypothetical protein [Treponema sp.]